MDTSPNSPGEHLPADIVIEKGVPVIGKKKKYPFLMMEVGDSFLVPSNSNESSFRSYAVAEGKRLKMKFAVKYTPDGFRCWRIS